MWFSEMTGTMIGSIGGMSLGLVGAAFGILASRWAPRGLKPQLVLGANAACIVLGLLLLAAGLTALFKGQPYHVWYPFMLLGGIMTAVMAPLRVTLRRVYAGAELRKMQIRDTGGL